MVSRIPYPQWCLKLEPWRETTLEDVAVASAACTAVHGSVYEELSTEVCWVTILHSIHWFLPVPLLEVSLFPADFDGNERSSGPRDRQQKSSLLSFILEAVCY